MQSARRTKSSPQIGSPSSKSAKAKGKERALESSVKRPPSQLKQGWALVPLVLNSSDNGSSIADKKRSRSPVKRRSTDEKTPLKSSKKVKSFAPRQSITIEIDSDSDDDEIQEIAAASSSKLTVRKNTQIATAVVSKVKREVVELDLASEEPVITQAKTRLGTPPVMDETFELDDDDDGEDMQNLPAVDDTDALDEADTWGDAEQIWQQRSRSGSRDGSTWAEEYGEDNEEGLERSADSDEDIREVSTQGCIRVCHQLADPLHLVPAYGERRR